jgi:hypothetical protein
MIQTGIVNVSLKPWWCPNAEATVPLMLTVSLLLLLPLLLLPLLLTRLPCCCCQVEEINLFRERSTNLSKGCGFITMSTREQAMVVSAQALLLGCSAARIVCCMPACAAGWMLHVHLYDGLPGLWHACACQGHWCHVEPT